MTESPFEPPSGQPDTGAFPPPADPAFAAQQAIPAHPVYNPYAQAGSAYPPETGQPRLWQQPPSAGRSRALVGVLGVVALLAAFGIGLATGRATAPKTASAAADNDVIPIATANGSAAAQAGAATAPAGTAPAVGGTLADSLISLPAGARQLPVTDASADGTMTLDQFLKELYAAAPSERSLLEARGFQGAATRWMNTADGQEDCVYLIEFATPDGAQSYALGLARAHEDDPSHASDMKFSVPVLTDGAGFENPALDSYGNTDAHVYGAVGNIAIILDTFTPAKLDRAEALGLVDEQAARLPS